MTPLLRQACRRAVARLSWPVARCAGLGAGVRILMYHRVTRREGFDQLSVSPQRFERQMDWLARRHEVVPLAEAVRRVAAGTPGRAVAITFDDGYLDNLENALPVLAQRGLPATVFVTARFCDQSARHPRYAAEAGRLHMDWAEVRRAADLPGITIGSHTLSHPHLPRLSEGDAFSEIHLSRRILQDQLGRRVDFFCYPNGDHGEREVRLVREAGYHAALSVSPGANRAHADLFRLKRTEVTDIDDAADMALKLAGAFDPVHALLDWRRRRLFAAARRRGATHFLAEEP